MFTVEKLWLAIDIIGPSFIAAFILTLLFLVIDKILGQKLGQKGNSFMYYIRCHQKFLLTYSLYNIAEYTMSEISFLKFYLLFFLFYIISSAVIEVLYTYIFKIQISKKSE